MIVYRSTVGILVFSRLGACIHAHQGREGTREGGSEEGTGVEEENGQRPGRACHRQRNRHSKPPSSSLLLTHHSRQEKRGLAIVMCPEGFRV